MPPSRFLTGAARTKNETSVAARRRNVGSSLMLKMRGPAVFLAQFLGDLPPFNNLTNIGKWFAQFGYKGVQIPAWDRRVFDLDQAAESQAYCDDYRATLAKLGLEPTDVAGYLQGQVLAVHPAYERLFDGFHPPGLRGAQCA